MKKTIVFLMTVLIMFSCLITVIAEDNITVLLDDKKLEFTDASPVIVNDRTMVPMRVIFEALGATIKWDEATSRVEAVFEDGTHILLYINKMTAFNNGKSTTLDAVPFLKDDRTYVPLRFVAESSGAKVNWDESTSTVSIIPPWKVVGFVPFGEFMTIASPASANKDIKIIEYTKNGSGATIKYDASTVEPDDIVRYEQYLVQLGYKQVYGEFADKDKIFYNGDYVIKTTLAEENNSLVYTLVLYQDKTGDTIKEYIAG